MSAPREAPAPHPRPSKPGAADADPFRWKVSPFVWLVLLFIGSRLLFLTLIHPDRFFILPEDELYQGTIAKELVSGLHMPYVEYRSDNYSGGSLVSGLIASGFFRLFGPTVFALKLTPLLFFTLALVLWVRTIQTQVSERVAWYFAALFICSPPLFTTYSLTVIPHSESILFTALTVLLLFRILSDPDGPPIYPGVLGLTAGFGLWFTYTYGITLVAFLLFWLWSDRAMWRSRRLALFASCFVVGFLPWLLINWHNGFLGLVVQDNKVWDHFGIRYLLEPFSNPRAFVPYQFLATLAADEPNNLQRRSLNVVYAVLYLAPIFASLLAVARSSATGSATGRASNLRLFGLLYLGLFALAVQSSDFKAARFNTVAYPFLFFFLAYALVLLEVKLPLVQNRIRTVFLSSLILVGIATHSLLTSLDGIGYAFSAKGYSYAELLGMQVCRDQNLECEDVILSNLEHTAYLPSIFRDLSSEDRYEMSMTLAQLLAILVPFDREPMQIDRLQRLIPPEFEKPFSYHLGRTAAYRFPNDLTKTLAKVEFLRQQSVSFHRLAALGVLDAWPENKTWPEQWPTDPSPESLLASPVSVTPDLLPSYWRALGYYAARFWYGAGHSLEQVERHLPAFVDRLDPATQRYLLQGVGKFLFNRWEARPVFALPFSPTDLERFPDRFHQGIFEGIGMGLSEFQLFSLVSWKGKKEIVWKTTTAGLSEANVRWIRQGRRVFAALFDRENTASAGSVLAHEGRPGFQ